MTGFDRVSLKSSAAFCGMLLAAIPVIVSPASANPAGGTVTTGAASIANVAKTTTINQTSEGVVIDWSSFNVGSGQTTNFVQPNASAIAVNRIGSASASQILGTLDANGRVVIINGNGLLFGKNAKVNVGALVATSTDGSDSDVLAGKFSKAGSQNASIINRGTINAASHGTVALVAPNVTNRGTVEAKLGTVSLGAANAFTVDFKGDGLVSFAAQGDVNAKASALNSGTLSGATVSMTAHAAEGIATGVVNTHGTIEAQGAHQAGGTIMLDAGNGSLSTHGIIDASGKTGGSIETSGAHVSTLGTITAGKGGQWTVDPEDLTIDSSAASTIDTALNAGTNVVEKTTSGPASGDGVQTSGMGDIVVASALSWSSTATLTLDSYHSITVDAPVSVTGKGNLTLLTNDGGTGGAFSFGAGDDVTFKKLTSGLSINGSSYTLVENIATLAADIAANQFGDYALIKSYNAKADGVYTSSPISTDLEGSFEGLGNTISKISIDDTTSDDRVGLFARNDGTIENLGLVSISYEAPGSANESLQLTGGLVGDNGGMISGDYATGKISATNAYSTAGGLVGANFGGFTPLSVPVVGTIAYSYANVTIKGGAHGQIGGLVGQDGSINSSYESELTNSYAMGDVSAGAASYAGGLAGSGNSPISNSYATGTVKAGGDGAAAGGLVGVGGDGISNSFATGATSVGANSSAGGLVGGDGGTYGISGSYATGAVTGSGRSSLGGLVGTNSAPITGSYATGSVTGAGQSAMASPSSFVGGLVGDGVGDITDSYATGAVSGGSYSYGGGLIGWAYSYDGHSAVIQSSYATGLVTVGVGRSAGGFVGADGGFGTSPASFSNDYWDTTSSGTTMGISETGITGQTTTQLQSGLPAGFDSSIWGESGAINGGLPYLLALPPT